jgi:hypothetical protein
MMNHRDLTRVFFFEQSFFFRVSITCACRRAELDGLTIAGRQLCVLERALLLLASP